MVPRNSIFTAQPLDEIEVVFTVLSAVFTLWTGADMKGIRVGLDAVPVEYLGDDLRHCQVLEDPLVVAELQIVQSRHQGQVITGQALARFTHEHIFDAPMYTLAIQAELEKRWLTEQTFKIEVRGLADEFNLDRVQAAD